MNNRKLLMIPGPIEFDPDVLAALGSTKSHVAPDFIDVFGQSLEMLRRVFLCSDGQPFILAGSGTLGMDFASANLIEPGDKALVVNTGYFSDRFVKILERYGAEVTQVTAPPGNTPTLDAVESQLKKGVFKLMTLTHVDTSTAVITNVMELAALARQHNTLTIVDGVCSVAGEKLCMTDWGVDLVLTASQKAIGVPPGLALIMVRPPAMNAMRSRRTPVLNYYADWNNWLPIMESYEARKPAYFATPAVNIIMGLRISLEQILREGLDQRFDRHRAISRACKAGLSALGLTQVPVTDDIAAHTISAPRYPAEINGNEMLARVSELGVVLAGGLHPAIRTEYFRIGHMGIVKIGDILTVLSAIEAALGSLGYKFQTGVGVAAAQQAFFTI